MFEEGVEKFTLRSVPMNNQSLGNEQKEGGGGSTNFRLVSLLEKNRGRESQEEPSGLRTNLED